MPLIELVGTRSPSAAVVTTKTESGAPEATTEACQLRAHSHVLLERGARLDNWITNMVQHQAFKRSWPQNSTPVLHIVPVQPQGAAWQQWSGDFNTILLRVSRSCNPSDLLTQGGNQWRTNSFWGKRRSVSRWSRTDPGTSAAAEVMGYGFWFKTKATVGGVPPISLVCLSHSHE